VAPVLSVDGLTHKMQVRSASVGLGFGPLSGHRTIGRIPPASSRTVMPGMRLGTRRRRGNRPWQPCRKPASL
jgi:hypothetical protein